MTKMLTNADLFAEKASKEERIISAIYENECCGGDEVTLWNACFPDRHIYHTGEDFDHYCREMNLTPTEIAEFYCYNPSDLYFFVNGLGEAESFEYLEESSIYSAGEMVDYAVAHDIDGGLPYVREILDEEEAF